MRYNNDPMNEDIKTPEETNEPVTVAPGTPEINPEVAPSPATPVEETKLEESAPAPEASEDKSEGVKDETPAPEKAEEVAA